MEESLGHLPVSIGFESPGRLQENRGAAGRGQRLGRRRLGAEKKDCGQSQKEEKGALHGRVLDRGMESCTKLATHS